MEIFLPEKWIEDPSLRAEEGVPKWFQSKHEIALGLLNRAIDAGIPIDAALEMHFTATTPKTGKLLDGQKVRHLVGEVRQVSGRVVKRQAEDYAATEEVGWLLLEQNGKEMKTYLAWGIDDVSFEEMVQYANLR